jgi:hypothetical protein
MGRIPLHYASASGAPQDVIEMLLDAGYPPKSCATPEDPENADPTKLRETFYGMTAADLAKKNGHDEVYQALTGKLPTKDFFMAVLSESRSKVRTACVRSRTLDLITGGVHAGRVGGGGQADCRSQGFFGKGQCLQGAGGRIEGYHDQCRVHAASLCQFSFGSI